MANEEQVKILKRGHNTWSQWLKENKPTKIDLSRADLSGADLLGANLSGTDLSYTKVFSQNNIVKL